MVLTAVAFNMMSIEFLTPLPIEHYIQTSPKQAEHLTFENLSKGKDCIIVTADKSVALVVMVKVEHTTKCKPSFKTTQFSNISPKTHLQLSAKNSLKFYKTTRITISSLKQNTPKLRPHGSISPAARFYGLPKIHNYAPHSFSLWHSIIQHCQIHH